MDVDFFFGPGSRYSYLASTQLDRIAAESGARFRWRVALSSDIAARAGNRSLFSGQGQYTAAYRLKDVERWAALYGVPFVDADPAGVNWRSVVLACAAADVLGHGEAFARSFFHRCHAEGRPVDDSNGLTALAVACGIQREAFEAAISGPGPAERYARNLDGATKAGAFGVPTFVTADGEMFWGQDRLPLLRQHLTSRAASMAGVARGQSLCASVLGRHRP